MREKETFRGLISKQKGTSKKNYRFRETHFRNATVLVNYVVKSRFKTMDKNIVYDRNQRNKADFSTLNFCLGDFGLKKGPKWDQI